MKINFTDKALQNLDNIDKNMTLKHFYIVPIKGYQYISRMLPASCRYYPTCSEYATWQFEFNPPHRAIWASSLRILRCNQLFAGGVDYPLTRFTPQSCSVLCSPNHFYGKIDIRYWLVPMRQESGMADPALYYIIKDLYDTHLALPT